jgi:tRNA dimethylallyltransferase
MTPEVVAVFGPTATGKTAVALELARRLGSEVVSADAMQVYRGLPILTNQPAEPTRLAGFVPLQQTMSVGAYAGLAHAAIDDVIGACGVAVVAGGTGLYLRAALAELALPPAPTDGARSRWDRFYDESPAVAHDRLRELDPAAAAAVHPNDRRRVVRALELAASGSSLVPVQNRLWSGDLRRTTVVFGLEMPPDELARRIEARTAEMFAAGVEREVRAALAAGVSATAAKALGMREIAALPAAAAEERIVVRTRRYAAYQRKWMRRIPDIVLVDATRPVAEMADEMLATLGRVPA